MCLIYQNARRHFSLPSFECFNTSDERFECSVVRLLKLITAVHQPRESDRFVPYIQRILFKLT